MLNFRSSFLVDFEFVCDNGKKILNSDRLCDGTDNCGDNSDETRPCQPSVTCEFESAYQCGYTAEGWQRVNGSASESGSLSNTGPSFDHTTGLDNRMAAYMVTSQNGSVLTTPILQDNTCFEFYFYKSSNSELSLRRLSTNSANDAAAVSIVRGAAIWQKALIDLTSDNHMIQFTAIINQPGSYIAIDDVRTYSGACTLCQSDEFQCADRATCISSQFRCDGIAHCLDASDETGCSPAVTEALCSFDTPHGCGMRQSANDDTNWKFQYGVPSNLLLPRDGHKESPTEVDNEYLLLKPEESWQKALISWPTHVSSDESCVTLWLIMSGTSVGSLEISSNSQVLWNKFGDQGRNWLRVRVALARSQSLELSAVSGQSQVTNLHLSIFFVINFQTCAQKPTHQLAITHLLYVCALPFCFLV